MILNRVISKFICLFKGHDWFTITSFGCFGNGSLCVCERCKKTKPVEEEK